MITHHHIILVMHTNNEVCTIQSSAKISELIKGKDILDHINVAQSVDKIEACFDELKVELQAMHDRLEKGFPLGLNGHPDQRPPPSAVAFERLEYFFEKAGGMQIPPELARGTLRFTTGRMTTVGGFNRALGVSSVIRQLRQRRLSARMASSIAIDH
ncbi:MAG: hypothetical protein EHM86_04025 [Desulfobulbaceae bacterium]|nr:MAG: hypothetical protein EHM86_04025 [Desulfobulbaceae bacterium]